MTGSFLSIGECMVELSDAGNGLYRRGFAGDTFNTAWYARRLLPAEWTISYGSCIGTDAVSAEMCAFMAGEGIDTTALRRLESRTVGLYMISLDAGERSFSYWRGQSAARMLTEDRVWLRGILSERDIVYFSGITLAILSSRGRDRLCDALAEARRGGAQIAFDTNLRPRLWEDRDTMRAGMRMGAKVADVVLPSFDEESWLFGDATPADTIARYRDCGARIVAVKDGGRALTLWDSGGPRSLPAIMVQDFVDTTAAGDSFAAAFLAGLASGKNPDAAGRSAMELAAKVIQFRGALVPGIFQGGTS
ncbi:2-keto-3-deoxygluconate kinase [Rhodovulum imhoffii]|uniref:2-dehydro-3-deoxygluconokinase n=2 Tax=Rhodovulum imhoffii TaxID=365340 RepID=A0A2T5BQC5_9RHOB|nr:sugar kinase [Rhodovulum imhoffii]PTN01343.1 2-keto-3-deoxygluconate kinase [Rhodovulum imhoffii]